MPVSQRSLQIPDLVDVLIVEKIFHHQDVAFVGRRFVFEADFENAENLKNLSNFLQTLQRPIFHKTNIK